MTHPYWTTLTIAVGLVAISIIGLVACLTGWAWTKWRTAAEHRAWAKTTRIDWDTEAQLLPHRRP